MDEAVPFSSQVYAVEQRMPMPQRARSAWDMHLLKKQVLKDINARQKARERATEAAVGEIRRLQGVVDSVCPWGKGKLVTVKAHNLDKPDEIEVKYDCLLEPSIFLMVREGDILIFVAQKRKDNRWDIMTPRGEEDPRLLPPPWVIIGSDDKDVIALICRVGKMPKARAEQVMKRFVEMSPGMDSAGELMSREAIRFQNAIASKSKTSLSGLLAKYRRVPPNVDVVELMRRWYTDVVLRQFYVLGITKSELRECKGHHDLLELVERVEENPYRVIDLPLNKADTIMHTQRRPINPQHRRLGEIAREMSRIIKERGDSAMTVNHAYELFGEELVVASEHMKDYGIVFDTEFRAFYASFSHDAETCVAARISELAMSPGCLSGPDDVGTVEQLEARRLDPSQIEAVRGIVKSGFGIITGRAGTGKTTVIKVLVDALEMHHVPYLLCSFTGKAVARIEETVRRPSYTIHSLLHKDTSDHPTVRGSADAVRVIIVDEVSMVPTPLLFELLETYQNIKSLIFVGDVEQIQPIEWGSLMRDVMNVNSVPVFRLTVNHRILDATEVDDAASAISLQSNIDALNSATVGGRGFHFIESDWFQVHPGGIDQVHVILDGLKNYEVPLAEVAVVTPYRESALEVNSLVRTIWFPDTVDEATDIWYIGARVMHTVNDYDNKIKNGNEGVIVDRYEKNGQNYLDVEYPVSLTDGLDRIDKKSDGSVVRRLTYLVGINPKKRSDDEDAGTTLDWAEGSANDILGADEESETVSNEEGLYTSDLCVSFAATIHKQQGSEYKYVIFYCPQHRANFRFLSRELVNVAITRAKTMVIVVGDIKAICEAAHRLEPARLSFLGERLHNLLSPAYTA